MAQRKEITLIKNNDKRDWEDLQWIEEFYKFLQGEIPEGMRFSKGHQPKMTKNKAMSIIWYLQEHLSVFPDHIEKCSECDSLYDSWREGYHSEKKGKCYCNSCMSFDHED